MNVHISKLTMLGVAVLASVGIASCGGCATSALDITADFTVPAEGLEENLVVKSGTTATITLNGDLTVTGHHAIEVEQGATATIKGIGTVEAIGKDFAPLYNNGIATIDGGTFYKDESKGTYYAIQNDRDMTINEGVVVMMDNTTVSSLVENGGVADGTRNLIINGGTFTGGVDSVKNDGEGVLTITGGNFTNTINTPIFNYHILTITGGTFNMPGGGNLNAAIYTNAFDPSKYAAGTVTITGGTFNAPALFTTDEYDPLGKRQPNPPVEIGGGIFNVDSFVSDDFSGNEEAFQKTKITGGIFSTSDVRPADGYFKYNVVDPATKEPVSVVTDEEVVFDDATIDHAMKVGDKYVIDLPELVLQYGVFNNFVGGLDGADGGSVELNGNSVVATTAGHATVTVSFNGKTRTYNFVIADTATDVPDVTPPVSTDENTDIAAPNTGAEVTSAFTVIAGCVVAILAVVYAVKYATRI